MKLKSGKKNWKKRLKIIIIKKTTATKNKMYDFPQFETIRYFGNTIYTEDQDKKQNIVDSVNAFYEGWEWTLDDFRNQKFPIKATQWEGRPHMLASRPLDLADVTRVAKVSDRKVSDRKQLKIFINS